MIKIYFKKQKFNENCGKIVEKLYKKNREKFLNFKNCVKFFLKIEKKNLRTLKTLKNLK